MCHPVLGRHALRRLPDHLEVPDDGILGLVIARESRMAIADVRRDPVRSLKDVGQVNARVLLHSGLASLRMRRRSSQ